MNHQRVLALKGSLCSRGVRAWFDGSTVAGNMLEKTVAAIESSQCVVVALSNSLISKRSSGSFSMCQFEVNTAIRRKPETVVFVAIEPLVALRNDSMLGKLFLCLLY